MLNAGHLPTLWDPEDLFSHLALWAGAPAIVVAVVVWLLGLYSSAKGWVRLGTSVAGAPGVVQRKVRARTTEQQRALGRLFLYSVLVVAFSYMLAEIVDVIFQMGETDPHAMTFSVKQLEAITVAVAPWPSVVVWTVVLEVAGIGLLGIACIAELQSIRKLVTFLGGAVCVIAWIVGSLLGLSTAMMILEVLFSKAAPTDMPPSVVPPVPFVVTAAVTVGLCLGLARFLPEVREASIKAFGSR